MTQKRVMLFSKSWMPRCSTSSSNTCAARIEAIAASLLQRLLANQLGAAGRVVDRLDLHAGQPAQESLALRQRLRVRVHHLDVLQLHTRQRQQAVVDLELHFSPTIGSSCSTSRS